MFNLLSGLLNSADESEWTDHVRDLNAGRLAERTEVLGSLHKLSTLVLSAIRKIEETTFEISSLLYKRKRKPGLKGASQTSKQRFCIFRPDGLHYYEKQGGKRLGVIELSSIEACEFLEGSEKTFVVTRSNKEIVEFTAENTSVARDWIAVLKPAAGVVLMEGNLMKKKAKKGASISKQRYVLLTKDSFKVFEEKGGRCLNSFSIDDVTANHVREGDVSAMKIQLPDGTTYSFVACSDPDAGSSPLEWVNCISRAKIGRKSQKPGLARASSTSAVIESRASSDRTSVDRSSSSMREKSQPRSIETKSSEANKSPRLTVEKSEERKLSPLSSSASSRPQSRASAAASTSSSLKAAPVTTARSSVPDVARGTTTTARSSVASKAPPSKAVPKSSLLDDSSDEEKPDDEFLAPDEEIGTTTEMINEIEACEARIDKLKGPPQKRLPSAPK